MDQSCKNAFWYVYNGLPRPKGLAMTEKCVIPALDAGNYSPKKIAASSAAMTGEICAAMTDLSLF